MVKQLICVITFKFLYTLKFNADYKYLSVVTELKMSTRCPRHHCQFLATMYILQ